MANQPSPLKQIIGARINRELYRKVEKMAEKHQIKISELLVIILEQETRDIELSADDYYQIAEEIKRAQAGANPRRKRASSKAQGKSED